MPFQSLVISDFGNASRDELERNAERFLIALSLVFLSWQCVKSDFCFKYIMLNRRSTHGLVPVEAKYLPNGRVPSEDFDGVDMFGVVSRDIF